MSIVIGVKRGRRIVVASDTLVCFGEGMIVDERNAVCHKARRIGPRRDVIIGTTGWGVYDSIMLDFVAGRSRLDLGSEPAIFTFFLDLWKELHERYPFVNDQAQTKDTPFGDLDASFLIASPGGLFLISNDLAITRFERHCAIGSGSEYALGAMAILEETEPDPRASARRAVEVAMTYDSSCGGSIEIDEIELAGSG